MAIQEMIHKLRTDAKLSQEQFAEIFQVSRQSVQKWESGAAIPELSKLIEISKCFDISLDALVLNRDNRVVEEMNYSKVIKPNGVGTWGIYTSGIASEYQQSIEEGLDLEAYQGLFSSVAMLPQGDIKRKLSDVLFEIVTMAKQKEGYPYVEPSELEAIKALRNEYTLKGNVSKQDLRAKLHGAWLGRACGCMLGKTVEGIQSNELTAFLKETGNFPMHRYIEKADLNEAICKQYNFPFANREFADVADGMPVDDDINYTVLAQLVIEKNGRDFTPFDISRAWLIYQSKDAYFTAEQVAYCNFINGFDPPQSAVYKNPYREWIGAQIRGDYFGYINPGNPELAAEMAWRDATVSHIKNGIYGEMLIAAMLAAAAVTNQIEEIILCGLGQIPQTSRLHEAILSIVESHKNGVPAKQVLDRIHQAYDESTSHGWCHVISNAMIVVMALLYGNGDFGNSICMAVEAAFDTDCNGATVGSILGMANGVESIPECWSKPINDTLHTSIFGVGTVKISDCVKKTMEHLK